MFPIVLLYDSGFYMRQKNFYKARLFLNAKKYTCVFQLFHGLVFYPLKILIPV